MATDAVFTAAACGPDGLDTDPVAYPKIVDSGTDCLHPSNYLMARDDGQLGGCAGQPVTLDHV
jgi:hypothetical protein